MTDDDAEWERAVLAEIEQTRRALGCSRATCALSDDTVAKIWTILILPGLVIGLNVGPRAEATALLVAVALMWLVGAIAKR